LNKVWGHLPSTFNLIKTHNMKTSFIITVLSALLSLLLIYAHPDLSVKIISLLVFTLLIKNTHSLNSKKDKNIG